MQSLAHLSNEVLIKNTENFVRIERETTQQILHHLLEIERRRIFAAFGFSSLFDFCVKKLGYSESGAQRRISSMRLLKSLGSEKSAVIEQKIQDGKLSLSVVSQAATFIQREAKATSQEWTAPQKEALLLSLEGHSAREAERKLFSMASQETQQACLEKVRVVTTELTELRVTLNAEGMANLEKVKALLSHKYPNASWGELVVILAQMAIKKLEPAAPKTEHVKVTTEPLPTSNVEAMTNPLPTSNVESMTESPPTSNVESMPASSPASKPHSGRKAIPAALKRLVWSRDEGRCQYFDPQSGRKCGGVYFLDFEHLIPVALGGQNTADNLTLLCRNHNQYNALQVFGDRMETWIPSLRKI